MTHQSPNDQSMNGESAAANEADEIFLPGDLVKSMPEEVLAQQKRVALAVVSDGDEDDEIHREASRKSREEFARQRQMAYLHKRRKQKKRQVFYNRLRQVLKACFAVFWLVVIWQLIGQSFWTLDEPRLVLLNQQLISKEHIQPLITPLAGKPVFAIRPDAIASQLKHKFPLIDEIYVRRYLFPARVELFVLEKQPWAELFAAPTLAQTPAAKINTPADGKNPEAPAEAPIAGNQPYGLITTDYDIVSLAHYRNDYHKDRYPENSIQKIIVPSRGFKAQKTFLKRLDKLAYKMSHAEGLHFQSLVVNKDATIRARYAETDVIVGRLDKSVYRRVDRLNALIPKILEMKDTLAAVDLRWGEQVTFHRK